MLFNHLRREGAMMMYKEYIEQVEEFKTTLKTVVDEMMNELDSSQSDLKKYDIVITVKGNSLTIPMNADSYSRLERMIEEEVQDAIDLDKSKK